MAIFLMDLTNIEGIERLECITVFTEVASQLSGNLHYLNETLSSLLCFIISNRFIFIGYRNNRHFPHTNPYKYANRPSHVTLKVQHIKSCSYIELGLPMP